MKILHVFDHSLPLQDGYSSRSWAILSEQRRRGWEVFPLTGPRQGSKEDGEETVQGLRFFRTQDRASLWGRLPVVKQFWAVWLMYRRLCQLIPQLRPDVLHAHSPALNGLAASWAARRFGLPLVYEVRAFWEDAAVDQGTSREGDFRYRLTRALENHVFRRADRVTAICEGLKADIEARGVTRAPVTVIPNAVEWERFAQTTERDPALAAQLGLTAGKTLGFVGSFYDYEGLDLLIDAMPALLAEDPQIRLLLVGGGLQDAALRERTRQLGLQAAVHFTGRVPFTEVERYYALIDVLVYPRKSLRLTELVTPLKPLEAMAQRKALVASDVGGHRELVVNGTTGLLYAAGRLDSLIDAVLRLVRGKDLQQRLIEQGWEFAHTERTWLRSVDQYEPLYSRLVKGRRAERQQ